MFQNLLYAVKRRILDEVAAGFQQHPAFSQKVKTFNKYPIEERVQFGVVMRNSAAAQTRLSADNFMSDLFSHVRVSHQDNYPGLAIEWVREDEGFITQYFTEDVSAQLGDTQRQFKTTYPFLQGPGNTNYADSVGQITVKVNGHRVRPDSADGQTQLVLLHEVPGAGSVVTASYHIRRLTPAGIYVIDFLSAPVSTQTGTQPGTFTVSPFLIVEKEILIAKTTGTEVSEDLNPPTPFQSIESGSETLTQCYNDGTPIQDLINGTNYTIDYTTGIITFLTPLLPNYRIQADYRYVPTGFNSGPFPFIIYQENHTAIPGVIMSIGRRAAAGDQQVIYVSKFKEQQAKIYGGHWQMSFDLSIIAKDSLQMEEMSDHVVNWLWVVRKNDLEFEGLTLNSVEPTGETEEVQIESVNDMYYESTVSVSIQTEWQNFIPYNVLLRLKNIVLIQDLRPAFNGPIVGFERLT
jgi:hypothetical protein